MTRLARCGAVLLGLALIATLMGGIAQTAAQTASSDALTARLGGNRQEFEAKYGQPTANIVSFVFPAAATYKVKGYGYVVAYYDNNQVFFIQLTPARTPKTSGYAPDPADWSVNKATELAGRFLPADAKLDPPKDINNGDKLISCTSQALAAAAPQIAYEAYDLNGKPGDCQAVIHLDSNGHVFLIDIGLGNGGAATTTSPISVPVKAGGTAAATATASTSGAGGVTLPVPAQGTAAPSNPAQATATTGSGSNAGSDYFTTVLAQMVQVKASLDNFTTLLNNAQPNDQTWRSNLNSVFNTWQQLYQAAQKLTPPASLQSFNQQYLQMLQLLNGVATDITNYLNGGDKSLLNDADTKLNQASDLFNKLRDQLLAGLPGSTSTPGPGTNTQ